MAKGRLTALLLAVVALAAFPLAAAVDMFIKFDTVPGDSSQPGHTDWFEVTSFSWGASSPNAAAAGPGGGPHCINTHALSFTRKGQASERLTQLCRQHAQMPSLTVDIGGERHMLQNVAFVQCQSQPVGGDNAFESYSLNFGRCVTHANAAAMNAAQKVQLGDVKINLNAILIGLTPRPEGVALATLNFMGPSQARVVIRSNNVQAALDELFRSHRTVPTASLTLNNGQKWTFTDVLVSSYQGGPRAQTLVLNFSKVDGPLNGYQDTTSKE